MGCLSGCDKCNALDVRICETCSAGYYLLDNKCHRCMSACEVCDSADSCSECIEDYIFVTEKKKCKKKC